MLGPNAENCSVSLSLYSITFGLNISIDSFPNEFMKICGYRGLAHSLTFEPGLSYFDALEHLLKRHWANCNQFVYKASKGAVNKILSKPSGYIISMAAMPKYSENLK